jgi:hypothetical protein
MLTLGTTILVVKIVKNGNNSTHTLLECIDVLAFSIFIELSDSFSNDDLIAITLSMKSPKSIPQLVALV